MQKLIDSIFINKLGRNRKYFFALIYIAYKLYKKKALLNRYSQL